MTAANKERNNVFALVYSKIFIKKIKLNFIFILN